MTVYESLKRKLTDRAPVTIANLMVLESPFLIDAFRDFDCVLLDKEHGIYGSEELIPLTMRCRSLGIPSIVRVEDSCYHLIAKAVDLGADGIMLPRVERMEQIKTAVEAMHFPPIGRTGFGGWGIYRDGETYASFQNGRIFLVQIESPRGRELISQMTQEYGDYIDGFIVGPTDYSLALGIPREYDNPLLVSEIGRVFDICTRLGKSCGCFGIDGTHSRLYREMGANLFWFGDESTYIRMGCQSMLHEIFQ